MSLTNLAIVIVAAVFTGFIVVFVIVPSACAEFSKQTGQETKMIYGECYAKNSFGDWVSTRLYRS